MLFDSYLVQLAISVLGSIIAYYLIRWWSSWWEDSR